ncbi:MAG: hypothetical protein SGCHY_004650 [Lobulomycetales sp.]
MRSPRFQNFLDKHEIDPLEYSTPISRYVRLMKRETAVDKSFPSSGKSLTSDVETPPAESGIPRESTPVEYMPGFYRLPAHLDNINSLPGYKTGQILGMDVSSAIAVAALDLTPEDHVLDLCCAPGAKLCMIADIIGSSSTGTVTGVDASSARLGTCRGMLKRVGLTERARLFCADGALFDVYRPSRIGPRVLVDLSPSNKEICAGGDRKKVAFSSRWLRNDPQHRGAGLCYSKVIVDAECTHDGSIR